MTTPDAKPTHPHEHRVTFPDLVRIHYRWRTLVGEESKASDAERTAADDDYHEALAKFEDEHGRIVSAYWCASVASAVALTSGKPSTRWIRRLFSVAPKFHRVSDWATKDDPEIAHLLQRCDELAIRSTEVLRGRARRICTQLVMTSASHLLSLIDADRRETHPKAHREAVESVARGLDGVAEDYRQSANGAAQLIYFLGMAVGVGFIGLLYIAGRGLLSGEDVQASTVTGCLVAGALGAVVSVIARINSGSFDLDEDVSHGYTLFLGGLRPWIGSIFGVLTYFAVTSGFVEVFKIPPDGIKQFYFLCVIAFGAGFSERWAQDTLTGGLSGRGRTPSPPSPPEKAAAAGEKHADPAAPPPPGPVGGAATPAD